jgi:hypothetical protein
VVGLLTGLICSVVSAVAATTLEVGPGKAFSRIEEANSKASPGDVILVYPLPADKPYTKTAVYVRERGLTFRAVPAKGARWVKISGKGFEYSGRGSTPRAVFQFNRATDDCVLEGFEILGAHTRVQYCYVHHSANREFDLVDSADTARPENHAVLMGNIIVKDSKCRGNRAVIHFGQDGERQHDGTAYLIYNTIVTRFVSPVVELSSPSAKTHLLGNLVCDGGVTQNNQIHAPKTKGNKLEIEAGAITEQGLMAGSLTETILGAMGYQAVEIWAAAGISAEGISTMDAVNLLTEDLSHLGGVLGLAMFGEVTIDDDAVGYGWYIDDLVDPYATDTNIVDVDLLTVMLHEYGHILGFAHNDIQGDIMNPTLSLGQRKMPEVGYQGATVDSEGALHIGELNLEAHALMLSVGRELIPLVQSHTNQGIEVHSHEGPDAPPLVDISDRDLSGSFALKPLRTHSEFVTANFVTSHFEGSGTFRPVYVPMANASGGLQALDQLYGSLNMRPLGVGSELAYQPATSGQSPFAYAPSARTARLQADDWFFASLEADFEELRNTGAGHGEVPSDAELESLDAVWQQLAEE